MHNELLIRLKELRENLQNIQQEYSGILRKINSIANDLIKKGLINDKPEWIELELNGYKPNSPELSRANHRHWTCFDADNNSFLYEVYFAISRIITIYDIAKRQGKMDIFFNFEYPQKVFKKFKSFSSSIKATNYCCPSITSVGFAFEQNKSEQQQRIVKQIYKNSVEGLIPDSDKEKKQESPVHVPPEENFRTEKDILVRSEIQFIDSYFTQLNKIIDNWIEETELLLATGPDNKGEEQKRLFKKRIIAKIITDETLLKFIEFKDEKKENGKSYKDRYFAGEVTYAAVFKNFKNQKLKKKGDLDKTTFLNFIGNHKNLLDDTLKNLDNSKILMTMSVDQCNAFILKYKN